MWEAVYHDDYSYIFYCVEKQTDGLGPKEHKNMNNELALEWTHFEKKTTRSRNSSLLYFGKVAVCPEAVMVAAAEPDRNKSGASGHSAVLFLAKMAENIHS